jgi:hypothetical protein
MERDGPILHRIIGRKEALQILSERVVLRRFVTV